MPKDIPLHPSLEKAVEDALWQKSVLTAQEGIGTIYSGLSQVILGAPASGKTSQAYNYARTLAKVGILPSPDFIHIYGGNITDLGLLQSFPGLISPPSPLLEEKDKVFIFDEIDHVTDEMAKPLASFISDIIDKQRGIVVITGYEKGTRAFLEKHPSLAKRLQAEPLVMPTPSPDELARRRGGWRFEWRENLRAIMTLDADVEAPAKAVFAQRRPES